MSTVREKLVVMKFGGTSVAAIDTDLVRRVLEPIWETKNETARRVRGRIEVILDWAAAGEVKARKLE